jgi:hypothetical protein
VSVAETWGTTAAERALPFPCDEVLPRAGAACWRGVTVHADAPAVFRWVCQLRAAPYSYDWLDNLGRRSPQQLTPGLERLAVGQRVMTIFELVSFEPDRHLTLRTRRLAPGLWPVVAVSYVVAPRAASETRLLVKLVFGTRPGWLGRAARAFLVWGDLVMMRRQLLNLKALAEAAPPPAARAAG